VCVCVRVCVCVSVCTCVCGGPSVSSYHTSGLCTFLAGDSRDVADDVYRIAAGNLSGNVIT
jgi:hypothetical protein